LETIAGIHRGSSGTVYTIGVNSTTQPCAAAKERVLSKQISSGVFFPLQIHYELSIII
jgi:hypothetical protein